MIVSLFFASKLVTIPHQCPAKSNRAYRHNAAMLHLGRVRVYEINPLDRDRVTADPTANASVLGQPEKVASISTQGRGDKKRIVALLDSRKLLQGEFVFVPLDTSVRAPAYVRCILSAHAPLSFSTS